MEYEQIVKATNQILKEYNIRLTIRQIYYRLVSPPFQIFPNNIRSYKAFDRHLTRAREKYAVDWRAIEDRRRNTIGGEQGLFFQSPKHYLDWLLKDLEDSKYYKHRYWDNQPKSVEVWIEKEALGTLALQACKEYKVIVFPSVGYSSFTKIMEAISRFPKDKETVILYFGDHDPSGIDMGRDLTSRLEDYGAGDFELRRIALTIEQVQQLGLASNPTKIADSRAPSYVEQFGDACWELDAVPPNLLQQWVKEAVASEVDAVAWNETQELIETEKELIDLALSQSRAELKRITEEIKARVV